MWDEKRKEKTACIGIELTKSSQHWGLSKNLYRTITY